MESDTSLSLRPRPGELVGVGVIAALFVAFGLAGLIADGFHPVFLPPFAFAAYVWFYLASIEVRIADGVLSFRRFWRAEWKIPVEHAVLGEGLGGDIPMFPAVAVVDRRTGKQVGVIIKSHLRPEDWRRFRRAVRTEVREEPG